MSGNHSQKMQVQVSLSDYSAIVTAEQAEDASAVLNQLVPKLQAAKEANQKAPHECTRTTTGKGAIIQLLLNAGIWLWQMLSDQ